MLNARTVPFPDPKQPGVPKISADAQAFITQCALFLCSVLICPRHAGASAGALHPGAPTSALNPGNPCLEAGQRQQQHDRLALPA